MFDWDDASEFFDEDFAETAVYNGKDILVIAYKSENETRTAPTGNEDIVDFDIMAQVSDFALPPKRGEVITFRGVDYRLSKVKTDSTCKAFILSLKGKYQ